MPVALDVAAAVLLPLVVALAVEPVVVADALVVVAPVDTGVPLDGALPFAVPLDAASFGGAPPCPPPPNVMSVSTLQLRAMTASAPKTQRAAMAQRPYA
jgi:hypothetical protein